MKALQPVFANPLNSILTVVDVQNRNANPAGEGWDEQKAQSVPPALDVITQLVHQARAATIPIVYVQSVRTLTEPEFTVFGANPSKRIGTWDVEIVEAIRPRTEDIVVQKFSHDAFFRTELDAVLERIAPDPTECLALVVGGATNLCVYHAVMGFHLRNFWTVVVTDAVYCRGEAARDRALEQFSDRSYRNIFLSRSDLVHMSGSPAADAPRPEPGR
jgi:ureidoacrylate peracid hydrolase